MVLTCGERSKRNPGKQHLAKLRGKDHEEGQQDSGWTM